MIKIADALRGVTRLGFDTAPLIYFVERNPACIQVVREVLFNSQNFSVLSIDAGIADRAADLRSRYQVKLPDALQIAAALEAGCEAFLTNDTALHSITDLRVIVLKDLEL